MIVVNGTCHRRVYKSIVGDVAIARRSVYSTRYLLSTVDNDCRRQNIRSIINSSPKLIAPPRPGITFIYATLRVEQYPTLIIAIVQRTVGIIVIII